MLRRAPAGVVASAPDLTTLYFVPDEGSAASSASVSQRPRRTAIVSAVALVRRAADLPDVHAPRLLVVEGSEVVAGGAERERPDHAQRAGQALRRLPRQRPDRGDDAPDGDRLDAGEQRQQPCRGDGAAQPLA